MMLQSDKMLPEQALLPCRVLLYEGQSLKNSKKPTESSVDSIGALLVGLTGLSS